MCENCKCGDKDDAVASKPKPGDGGEFEQSIKKFATNAVASTYMTPEIWGFLCRELRAAHNSDRAADKQRIAELEEQLAEARRTNDRHKQIIAEIHDMFYGQGYQVLGWHLNGDTEPMDSFFESNDWEV